MTTSRVERLIRDGEKKRGEESRKLAHAAGGHCVCGPILYSGPDRPTDDVLAFNFLILCMTHVAAALSMDV